MLFDLSDLAHLGLDRLDLVLQMRYAGTQYRCGFPVCTVELIQILSDCLLQVLHSHLDLVPREVLVPRVDRLELAAVNRDHRLGEQVHLAAQHHEPRAHLADRQAVVSSEVGNRLEVGHQPPGQPDQLDVALGLALQASTRLDAVQVPVNVDLQERRRVVARAARGRRQGPLKPQHPKVELVDEDIDHPYRIVFRNPIVQPFRKQHAL